MVITGLLGFRDALREWLVDQKQGRAKPYGPGCCSSVSPFATCSSSQNRCCCPVFTVGVTYPFPPCGNVFVVVVVVYFILFVFFFKLFRMSCLTLPRVSCVDKPGLHSIKWSGDWWHPSPSCVTLVGLSVTDGAKSATSLRPLSKGSKLMNWEANVVTYFGICTTNGLSPIKRMEEIARSMPAS